MSFRLAIIVAVVASTGSFSQGSGGPYCGVHSVYAALKIVGIQNQQADLLDRKYVGSISGSTVEELARAVQDHGGHALALHSLTAASLRASQQPIILHVRRPGFKVAYEHWVVFMGMENDMAIVFDPPGAVMKLSIAELLSIWDGVGIVVTRQPGSAFELRAASYLVSGLIFTIALIPVAAFRNHQWLARRGLWFRLTVFATYTIVLAALLDKLSGAGLLQHHVAIAQVKANHFEPEIEKLDIAGTYSRIWNGAVVIDVRIIADYRDGHIPGAISLPVISGLTERSQVIENIPSSSQIVVYCQSDRCTWAKGVAADLFFRGYHRIAVFEGGFHEWEQRYPEQIER